MGNYSIAERWLPCAACGAPIAAPVEGGELACSRCGGTLAAPARPDTRVPPTPPSDEAARRARLEAQDGKPLFPPDGFEQLVAGSDVPPHKLAEAQLIWSATRKQLLTSPADLAAAERMVWLTMVLRNTLTEPRAIRALLEGALEVLMLPRHRQQILGDLSRDATKEGDLASARGWLERCDPASEDLQADSAYRVSRAFLATAQRDFTSVLEVLGATEEEVPIDDSMDPLAVVLRANAWERLGRVDAAQNELTKLMGRNRAAAVEMVVGALPREWSACAQSIEVARTEVRQLVGARAASQAGGAFIGWILLVVGSIPLGIVVLMIASGELEWPMLLMLIAPLILGPLGWGMIAAARRTKEIAEHGLHGAGRIVAVSPTGTRINDTPLMRIDVQIAIAGHPEVMASAKRLMHGGGELVGQQVAVIWHPKYPNDVVLDG
jgi:hypothetical protein